jgi:orotate phosphoribosyltransferase
MFEQDISMALAQVGAIITDSHVVYTSGKHGSAYVNKDAIYPHTGLTAWLCGLLAQPFVHDTIDIIVGPAMGGITLSQRAASHLSSMNGRDVLSIYAERSDDGKNFVIKRGYDKLLPGKRALVVEDVLTTGESARKVIDVVRALGGEVIGLSVLCNRGDIGPSDIGVPRLASLIEIRLDSWDSEECPLCKRGIAINTDVGKGREFLARKCA